ncbi:hypothetical protein BB050_02858 [Flavobacterium anhuiense]|uniref:DUF3732 domain-containing protein n=1 Tax=Flavobacterium anhuiense TaxID=459526 RepID=A0AAC9D3S2_9FLAO|nr:DUF3732 domain-containing protein [Flavobacterium anhuiense]AOC95952.1 hypothetical protein BB050_02858 [Flavobacterium anhuiense]
MNITIKKIVIFDDNNQSRFIGFNDGLNIITGDSKTGKSAIIEIIDYCLFSSRSSIPKGKITDFAELFVVIYKINDFYLVVGRPAQKTGNMNYAYLNVESDYNELENIDISYFENLSLRSIKNDIQTEFEQYIGLAISNMNLDNVVTKLDNKGKLSIRDTVSFLFQHQNLIANKHAIFYRFDDIIKRKRVIEAFPVLLGAVDENYYDLIRQEKEKLREIKTEKIIIDKLKLSKENELSFLRNSIQVYYSLIDKTLEDNLTLGELKRIGINLPFPSEVLNDRSKVYLEIDRFEKERNIKYIEKEEIEKALVNLYQTSDDGYDYAKELMKIHAHQKYNKTSSDLKCPICESTAITLKDDIAILESSKEKLVNELIKLGTFSQDNTPLISELKAEQKRIEKEILSLTKSINILAKEDEVFIEAKNEREQIIYQKGKIESLIKSFLDTNSSKGNSKDLVQLESDLKIIREELSKYNPDKFKKDSEDFLKENMDRICGKLDFEEELKPVDLYFNIEDFSFYHKHEGGKIRLDEMGSGANWLASHLSIFLSFLYLNLKNEKSVIPGFLVLDQPSQVYFPRSSKKSELTDEDEILKFDDNINQVKNIFKVLNEEIELIKKETGVEPQIIVLEHANDESFDKFIIKDWDKSKGQGLI